MTVIALHAHSDVSWVSWRFRGTGFGKIHLERTNNGATLCGAAIPNAWSVRVVRNQESAAIDDICRSCLKEYATHHEEHQ